jgi:ABC-type glycerol-3-phosphate transport system substrate-binding protein
MDWQPGIHAGLATLFTTTNSHARGPEAFFESIWNTGFLQNNPSDLWGVPWLGDVMLLYYWDHLIKQAGIIDAEAAFASDEAFIETLERLRKAGVEYPLAINIRSDSIILHEAAHWN